MLAFIAQADPDNDLTIPDLGYMLSVFFTVPDEALETSIIIIERFPYNGSGFHHTSSKIWQNGLLSMFGTNYEDRSQVKLRQHRSRGRCLILHLI